MSDQEDWAQKTEELYSKADSQLAEDLKWRILKEMSESSPEFALIDRLLEAWRMLLKLPFSSNSD